MAWSDNVAAEPIDYLQLSAADSSDDDGDQIIEYRWSLVKAPEGFSVGFDPSNRTVETQIQLAMVGDYVIELTVTDQHGLVSCEPARIQARTRSDKSFVVELTWRTPSDPDETDTCTGCGTDLDLHMIRPGGMFDDKVGGSDCHFRTMNPMWGDPANLDDNPHLDRDDADGGGPEQINIKSPARTDGVGPGSYTAPYEIGVYYYDDHGFEPPVWATVRVYLNGDDVPTHVLPSVASGHEQAMRMVLADPIGGRGHFWHVGELFWTETGSFVETDPATQPRIGFP